MGLCKPLCTTRVRVKFILNIYIVFMYLDCVLSIAVFEIAVFIVKTQWYAQLMEDPRIVLCDNNLVVINVKTI